jgi:acyl transferase domain-containing protein
VELALFALEYALAMLWQSWGVRPDIVLGHDIGAYAAACVAGVFSLEDGLKLAAQRSGLAQTLQVTCSPPLVGLISGATGQRLERGAVLDIQGWRQHLETANRLSEGIQTLYTQGCNLMVELGPEPMLLEMARQCGLGQECGAIGLPSLRKGVDDWRQMAESLSRLYVHGVNVDWTGFERDDARRRMWLPTYPFQRRRYWMGRSAHQGPMTPGPGEHVERPSPQSELLRQLEEAVPSERAGILLAHVREQVSQMLGLDPSHPLELGQSFKDLGLGSLMAVELRNMLGNSLGCALPPTLIFDYPSVGALADYLGARVLAWETRARSRSETMSDQEEQAVGLAELKELAEDEVEALLSQELDRIGY